MSGRARTQVRPVSLVFVLLASQDAHQRGSAHNLKLNVTFNCTDSTVAQQRGSMAVVRENFMGKVGFEPF